MVLSLVDICRLSLRNAVESGPFPYLHVLPPNLRQSMLDMVLVHGTISDPNCVENLGSIDSLRRLWSLDTQKGNVDDKLYLDRVAQSMSATLPNGETIGSGITKLSLNLYANSRGHHGGHFNTVIRLIAQCPSLASLNLRMAILAYHSVPDVENEASTITTFNWTDGGLLNEMEAIRPALSVVENLSEFSFTGANSFRGSPLLVDGRPIIEFKKLTALRLERCIVFTHAWRQFLERVQGTLTELRVKDLELLPKDQRDGQFLLPFPLPRLKTFKLEKFESSFERSLPFIQNLSQCKELDYVRLELGGHTTDEQLAALASINATLDIDLRRVKSLCLKFRPPMWAPEYTAAIERALDGSLNLTDLYLMSPPSSRSLGALAEGERREAEKTEALLASFFNDQQRALKLKVLNLIDAWDYNILKSVFENCLRLDWLSIYGCQQLCDDHLVEWAKRGARPRKIWIWDCENVSDAGLIPLLVSSGGRLTYFVVDGSSNGGITSRTWHALIDHCLYVGYANVPDELAELWHSKSFRSH